MDSSDVAKDKEFKKQLKDVRGRITRLESLLEYYENQNNLAEWQIAKMEGIQEGIDEKRKEEANILEERHQHALQSDTGIGNRLRAGMITLKEKVDTGMRKESKLPKEALAFCYLKLLQRAGATFDMRRTGTEMTVGRGINMLEKWPVVAEGLLKLFDRGTTIYEWLVEKTPKWEYLVRDLMTVHVFLK